MSARPMLLIKEFLITIGMDFGDQLEHENSVLLEMEGGLVLSLWAQGTSIIAASPIATVPKEKEAKIYRECLAVNFTGFPEITRFFSIDPESRELVLMASWGVAETPFEVFLQHMTEFAELAQQWHDKLVTGTEHVTKAPEETSSASTMLMDKA